MFVTMPAMEQFMPPAFVVPGHKHWRAVTLSFEHPVFLVQYDVQHGAELVTQTTLVAWEEALIQVLRAVAPERRRAVCFMHKELGTTRWSLDEIQAIWAPGEEDLERGFLVLLQLKGDPCCRDVFLSPAPPAGGRQLLFESMAST